MGSTDASLISRGCSAQENGRGAGYVKMDGLEEEEAAAPARNLSGFRSACSDAPAVPPQPAGHVAELASSRRTARAPSQSEDDSEASQRAPRMPSMSNATRIASIPDALRSLGFTSARSMIVTPPWRSEDDSESTQRATPPVVAAATVSAQRERDHDANVVVEVRGYSHAVRAAPALAITLVEGTELSLAHESDNAYDTNAIRVQVAADEQPHPPRAVGYVPREIAALVASGDVILSNARVHRPAVAEERLYMLLDLDFPRGRVRVPLPNQQPPKRPRSSTAEERASAAPPRPPAVTFGSGPGLHVLSLFDGAGALPPRPPAVTFGSGPGLHVLSLFDGAGALRLALER